MSSERKTTGEAYRPTPSVLIDERLLPRRFLLVSNRLPYSIRVEGRETTLERGVGGLVTALDPIMRRTGGTWIGWSGTYDNLRQRIPVAESSQQANEYYLKPLHLNRREVEEYYLGYSNNCIWPLFHYFQEHCRFNREQWKTYKEINRRFAEAIAVEYQEGDLVWIHDYHLLLLPAMVRELLPDARIGFFLHIPFPSEQIFLVEPHAEELLEGLLGSDLIGFHVDSYARNFMDSVSAITDYRCAKERMTVRVDDRFVKLGSFPISIDFDFFADIASREDTSRKAREIRDYYHAEVLAIGVDRLDYTKGILERLHAIESMLERHPDVQGKFTFIQISAPSRTKVHAYREMREQVEGMVGRINGRFSGEGCIPIDYRYESFPQEDLVAYYRASDLALITPLRDGMNLVAKEYVASKVDETGVLVLSRFTGAYSELDDALVVNPYDSEAAGDRIYQAITMPSEEKQRRLRRMQSTVRRNDIYWWLECFLRELLRHSQNGLSSRPVSSETNAYDKSALQQGDRQRTDSPAARRDGSIADRHGSQR